MNDYLQNRVADLLGLAHHAAAEGLDLARDQLPDLARQYVRYGRVYHGAVLLISILALIASALIVHGALSRQCGIDGMQAIAVTGAVFLSIGAAVAAIYSVELAALAWLAPTAWVLKLLRQGGL